MTKRESEYHWTKKIMKFAKRMGYEWPIHYAIIYDLDGNPIDAWDGPFIKQSNHERQSSKETP